MPSFTLYGFCLVVSASLVALLSMSTDFFVHWVNDIVIPCQHDSVWTGMFCNCDNTRGVYAGDYCDECQCKHQGICAISNKGSTTRWGCLCPSHKKWTGLLCDKCYAERQNMNTAECSGPCLNTSTHQHFGAKCDTVCVPDSSALDPICQEIASGGGVCNACNGHGTCGESGACECDEGWFTTLGGEQCALSCESAGIECPEDRGICRSIGGELQCVCAPGYYGRDCELSCGSINDKQCSGHGTCGLTALGIPACTCDLHYVGDSCEYTCPGDQTYPSTCSGHGRCTVEVNETSGKEQAMCTCLKNSQWTGYDCSCNSRFSCSGHGTCQDDASCLCNNWTYPSPQHWEGKACQKCQANWYGRECHLMCDADGEYLPDAFANRDEPTDGVHIGCNGFGSCDVISTGLGERVQCSCRGTDPMWFCSKCEANYYPLTSVKTAAAYCTQECNEAICSFNGVCNEDYDGTNNLCICDKITVGTVEFDTIDPVEYCSTCKLNWFPDLRASDEPCTHYCAANGEIEGRIIVFGEDRSLEGDVNAQKVCARNDELSNTTFSYPTYSPDPDCRVCSGQGTCDDNGQCVCNDARTGLYCEIDCGTTANGQVCNGHGRCVRNDLDMWFDPFTAEYRCECQPYDTYTSEARQRLLKRGVFVEPPPTPHFYGKYCEFHCPRYNEDICAGRGECKTGITVPTETNEDLNLTVGVMKTCTTDTDCAGIPGAFCAQLSAPWDSLMSDDKSYFSSGPESPGYFSCASSQNCVDSIYSIEWDSYCVNMLNGWYPNVLNTATCTYHIDDTLNCREKVENFFVSEYNGEGRTWCESALSRMAPIAFHEDETNSDACGKHTHASERLFNINRDLCFTWDLKLMCDANPECIYDQTIEHIEYTDQLCAQTEIDNGQCCSPNTQCPCEPNAAKDACITKTYCRARNCQDAILDNNIESLCVSVEPACANYNSEHWSSFCTKTTGRLRNISDMSVQDTFYTCVMYENSINPYLVRDGVPGSIDIYGEIRIRNNEFVPVQEFRTLFLDSRSTLDLNSACGNALSHINFSDTDFCSNHLLHVLPSWYEHHTETGTWFREYMVVCSGNVESLYTNAASAVDRAALLRKKCAVEYKCGQRLDPSWDATCDDVDSTFQPGAWTLECLTSGKTLLNTVDWSVFPDDVSDCTLRENTLVTRWGGIQWEINDIASKFKENCERGLEAPWIPTEEPIPTVCSMGACAEGHTCTLCSETSLTDCHKGVVCVAPVNIDCFEDRPCRNGGECFQPTFFLASNKYLCEWEHNEPVMAYIDGNEYPAELTSRNILVVSGVTTETDGVIVVVSNNGTIATMADPDVFESDDVRVRWNGAFIQCETLFCPRTNKCVSNCSACGTASGNVCMGQAIANASTGPVLPPQISSCTNSDTYNWYEYCSAQPLGYALDTSGGNGLKSGWSGHNPLLQHEHLMLESATSTISGQLEIIIDTAASDADASLSLTVNSDESVWHVTGEVLAYTNYAYLKNTQTIHVKTVGYVNGTVTMRAMFGKKLILQSVKVAGVEQIADFADTLEPTRFYLSRDTNVTNYAAWSFEADGTTSVYREPQEVHPSPFKCCTVRALYWNQCALETYDNLLPDIESRIQQYACPNGTSSIFVESCTQKTSDNSIACSAESVPTNGQRWPISTSYQKRIHGWTKIQPSQKMVANMDVYNADASAIVQLYVFQNRVYVNDVATECRVKALEWWHWTIDLHAVNETLFQSESEIRIHPLLRERANRKLFEQTWKIVVQIDDCTFEDIHVLNTTAHERKTPGLMGSHFHHVTATAEHECQAHCHGHEQCQQWSWTPAGQDCFLHAAPCHEGGCTLGSHSMNTFHARGVSYFDIWSSAKNTRVYWNHIRVEDIIETPAQFICTPVDINATLPEKWRTPFKTLYQPLLVDATRVCNAIHSMWQPLPGYTTGHCSTDEQCEYQIHDMNSCANYIEHAKPNVSAVDACQDEKELFLDIDWTSYCQYQLSFHDKNGEGVPFLGGRTISEEYGNLQSMCQEIKKVRDEADEKCNDSVDTEWFRNCFERTSAYENFCSADCISYIESMLDETDQEEDPSICTIRQEYLNLESLGLDSECDCSLDNLIVTDFCLTQNAYHVGNNVKIPELYNSECSRDCMNTLQDSMNRTQWRTWCKQLSSGIIPGTCSKTVCECDTDNIGVAGTRCELTCPSGTDNGEELACSGRNGRCFAVNEEEIVEDPEKQELNGEYRDISFAGPNEPVWLRGPSPTAEGRCQCALGSGTACSIPCDKCNNGTYGYDAASQYGICDSFSGVCRSLSPWMRYNFHKAVRESLSTNTTSFETTQGLAKWVHEDRFLFENDPTLLDRALKYAEDSQGLDIPLFEEPTVEEQDSIIMIFEVFEQLCWDKTHASTDPYYFAYLDNDASVTRHGLNMNLADIALKTVNIEAPEQCRPIEYSDELTMCYYQGNIYAKDPVTQKSLIVVQRNNDGITRTSDSLYLEGMTFTKHISGDLYAFGGEIEYAATSQVMNNLYRIQVERRPWSPVDIIILTWHSVKMVGSLPPGQRMAPIAVSEFMLYIVSGNSAEYSIYAVTLPTPISPNAMSSVHSVQVPLLKNHTVRNIKANDVGQFVIYVQEYSVLFTPEALTPFVRRTKDDNVRAIWDTVGGYSSAEITCRIKLVSEGENTVLKVAEQTVANVSAKTDTLRIYMEEWTVVDVTSQAALVQRFRDTLVFGQRVHTVEREALTESDKMKALELVERIYMHQGRWLAADMFYVKTVLSPQLWPQENMFEHISVDDNMLLTSDFKNVFDTLDFSFFASDMRTSPSFLSVNIEGRSPERRIIIQGNYIEPRSQYTQTFYIGSHKMEIYMEWSANVLRLKLQKRGSSGFVQWVLERRPCRTFLLSIEIEHWLTKTAGGDEHIRTYTHPFSTQNGRLAMFNLFVSRETSHSHLMKHQTYNFLAYSPSHCSATASEQCPGLLPHVQLPCSGHGRCNTACQCICEVAPSVLQTSDSALQNVISSDSPYRGDGCEITCPGFDGYDLNSICSGRGTCQYDGSCACEQGFIGDACQFECPLDDEGNPCSTHGGCGTRATEITSFQFTGNDYLDAIEAMNMRNYIMALSSFYSSCSSSNYIYQRAEFKSDILTANGGPYASEHAAFEKCEKINLALRQNMNINRDQEFRDYPYGICIGIKEDAANGHLVVTLDKPNWIYKDVAAISIFDCVPAECTFEPDETNDNAIAGFATKLLAPSFEITMKYVHGASSGTEHYKVNGYDLYIETEWTPYAFRVLFRNTRGLDTTEISYEGYIMMFKMVVEGGSAKYKLYKDYFPVKSDTHSLWLAPLFEHKYIKLNRVLDGYVMTKDMPYLERELAEYDCDLELLCEGIVQWDQPYRENLFSLYSPASAVRGFESYSMPANTYLYFGKMTMLYQGRENNAVPCDTISDKRSKYPTVQYTEMYDIPIENIDISLAKDEETQSVIIGRGLWTSCWIRDRTATTKKECYDHARSSDTRALGFAFSEDERVCLIYHKLTDPTRIKLGRYNSESRLSIFHPCNTDDSTYWRPVE